MSKCIPEKINTSSYMREIFFFAFLVGFIIADCASSGEIRPRNPRPNSPHWDHINILDFARGVRWIGNRSVRAKAYGWLAKHVDVASVDEAERVVKEFKSRNSSMKSFRYALDLTICRHKGCSWKKSEATWVADLPEEYFLHFSEDTQLKFVEGGKEIMTVDIPGCPEPRPLTRESRVQVFIWSDSRWVFNVKNSQFQAWMAKKLVTVSKNVDGIFFDEHGPGFKFLLSGQTKLVKGGGIREYGGKKPLDKALNKRYNTDVAVALNKYSSTLKEIGKFLFINTAEYSLDSLCIEQIMAARGVHTEFLHRPDRLGAKEYKKLIRMTRDLIAMGGMADLYGSDCYYGPRNYTKGNFSSPRARYEMWSLASYYILKESMGSPGIVYYDPTLCIKPKKGLDFIKKWLPAYQVDVGSPVRKSYEYQKGTAPDGFPYTIFAREYTNSLVLLRPKGDPRWKSNNYDDRTAVNVNLPSPMKMLMDDGSLSPPQENIRLRNAEAVVLFKSFSKN
jgi:hypothetical protein